MKIVYGGKEDNYQNNEYEEKNAWVLLTINDCENKIIKKNSDKNSKDG